MVKEIINKAENVYYECEECKLNYKEKKWAEKCENWCKKNKSCNIKIIKHAINKKGGK